MHGALCSRLILLEAKGRFLWSAQTATARSCHSLCQRSREDERAINAASHKERWDFHRGTPAECRDAVVFQRHTWGCLRLVP
jgi:hypothetical protein